jgi:apolipoprotein N-acyltransferase
MTFRMSETAGSDCHLWGLAIGGAITMFLAQPPADLWWGAWLAPLPWLLVVAADPLPGRRPWRTLWIAGFLHWLLTIHWLRLPHPATSIGWVMLSAYLAAYVPLFVWLARRLVHAWRWPLVPAAALAWMACEQLRGWVLGGFTFGGLGHTQWRWTTLIQCADTLGAVGVGGVVIAVAAGLAAALPRERRSGPRSAAVEGAMAVGVLAAALAYGSWRIATAPVPQGDPLEILLVQGSIDTELKHDPDAAADVARHYDELTVAGLAAWPAGGRPDLVVWPETMWRWGLVEIDPAEVLEEEIVARILGTEPEAADAAARAERQARCREALAQERLGALAAFARRYATCWLVGLDRQVIAPMETRHYNCGLFLDATGRPMACYCKMHPVMFGEYIPLADRFPFLYGLTPLPAGLTAGTEPVAVGIAGRRVAANICYETAVPGAVRDLVRTLEQRSGRPDVLVNLTNDGWFWGSSELDMHLAAAIFRAVEVRTPIAIAANTGFSAAIDGSGRLLARGPRRATASLQAKLWPDGRTSPWLVAGTLPLGVCVAVAVAVTLEACLPGRSRGRLPIPRGGLEAGDGGRAGRKLAPAAGRDRR